ncbi:hypothetical protein TNCV_4592401 [Trichonephila clavipes]|nr:hypothetical protein TNCV_4592401 [Trichonephila clavipes]
MLNDDEIVTSVQAESNPIDDETDEDEDNNNESSKGSSNAGTFSALETAMECRPFRKVASDSDSMALGLGSNPGEGSDVCKCVVPLRHIGTQNICRATSLLVRLAEVEVGGG